MQKTSGSHLPAKNETVVPQLRVSFKEKSNEKVTSTKTGKEEGKGNNRGNRHRCLGRFNGTIWIVINKISLLPGLLVASVDCQFVLLGGSSVPNNSALRTASSRRMQPSPNL